MSPKPMLCPRCRHLIGSDETACSWCGATRAASWWHSIWRRGASDDERIIRAVIAANVLFYILSLMLGQTRGILSPDQSSLFLLGATGTIPLERYGRVWTLLSANYLHGGPLHILFNMMALRQIAPWVVREFGASRMFVIYTVGGICGYGVSWAAGIPFTIGASASICGLIGSLLYYGRSRGGAYGQAVYREVSGWVVGLVLFGLVFPGINNWGHGGGILGGMLLGLILGYDERRRETALDRFLAILCAVATVGALGWSALWALAVSFAR
jgi:rhomboid protease GluP